MVMLLVDSRQYIYVPPLPTGVTNASVLADTAYPLSSLLGLCSCIFKKPVFKPVVNTLHNFVLQSLKDYCLLKYEKIILQFPHSAMHSHIYPSVEKQASKQEGSLIFLYGQSSRRTSRSSR
jgi:hypothetical protein